MLNANTYVTKEEGIGGTIRNQYEDFYVDSEAEVIYVSTIHKSKGREFDSVYMMLKDAHGKNDEERHRTEENADEAPAHYFFE